MELECADRKVQTRGSHESIVVAANREYFTIGRKRRSGRNDGPFSRRFVAVTFFEVMSTICSNSSAKAASCIPSGEMVTPCPATSRTTSVFKEWRS